MEEKKSIIIPRLNKKVGGVVLTVLVSIILLVVVILPVSFALFKNSKEISGTITTIENNWCINNNFNKLSDCILVSETKSSTVAAAKNQISSRGTPNFSQIAPPASGEDTVSGMYSASDDDGTSYYYRGDIKNNYVSFAGYIWRIIRENGDGTVRMIYSGASTLNTGKDVSIGVSPFNDNFFDPTYVGYKYSENFSLNEMNNSDTGYNRFNGSVIYYFGEGYIFDETTRKFRLTGNTISGTWKNTHTQALASYPYTCFSTSATGTCDVMIKVVAYQNESLAIVHVISNSSTDYNSTLLNTTNSSIKTKVDYWYEENILNKKDTLGKLYSSYISDEVFCNSRSLSSGSGYLLSPTTLYGSYNRLVTQKTPTLRCEQEADKFSVSSLKGNGNLKYPIGLITVDEVSMAGGVLEMNNTRYYLYTNDEYWTMSPAYFHSYNSLAFLWIMNLNGNISPNFSGSSYSIRPVISLSPDVLISGGDGTAENPYTVKLA